MNVDQLATHLVDAAKRLMQCKEDFPGDEEFELVIDLGMYLRQSFIGMNFSVSDSIMDVKKYKKLVIKMSKAGVENSYLIDEREIRNDQGAEIKRIVDRLAEIWKKSSK